MNLASSVIQKWRTFIYVSLKDDILSHAVLLKEANAISVELKKKVEFQFALLTDTLFTPLPLHTCNDDKQARSSTVVAVEVQDKKNSAKHYWSLQKLRSRLDDMRFIYETAAESTASVTFESGDPFYDDFPWFRLIGRSFVYFSNLVYGISLDQATPIISEAGEIQGYVLTNIQHCEDQNTEMDEASRSCVLWLTFDEEVKKLNQVECVQSDDEDGNSFSKGSLIVGSKFIFEVKVVKASGLPLDYTDIFCQIRFLDSDEDVGFSTEPVNGDSSIEFNHHQKVGVMVTKEFINYVTTKPLQIQIFGHYRNHPQHLASISVPRDVPKATNDVVPPRVPERLERFYSQSREEHHSPTLDFVVWIEIFELSPSGEYFPCIVKQRSNDTRDWTFLIHQGIQRRLVVTIMHENSPDFRMRRLKNVTIGQVRTSKSPSSRPAQPLSLNILSPQIHSHPDEEKTIFKFEASWDSSLHNSLLLNRVTPPGEAVFVTLSAYIEMDSCCRTACLQKDLCLEVFSRDAKTTPSRSVWKFLTGSSHTNCYKYSGIFDLTLYPADSHGRVRRPKRKVVDTSTVYVRGEENLQGWKPKGPSIIDEHQKQLDKLERIHEVGKARHILTVAERLREPECTAKLPQSSDVALLPRPSCSRSLPTNQSSLDRLLLNTSCLSVCSLSVGKQTAFSNEIPNEKTQECLLRKCLQLLTAKKIVKDFHQLSQALTAQSTGEITSRDDVSRAEYFVPIMKEIRKNPVIAKTGYLAIMDDSSSRWKKIWVVIRKPYVIFHNHENDPIEHFVINLKNSKVECSEDQNMRTTHGVLSLRTRQAHYLLQPVSNKEDEVHEWLYALDPLLMGRIRSQRSSLKGSAV